MHISIIGTGYVGLVTGTCLANFGLSVTCIDSDKEKIECLNNGKVPIYEPNLEEIIQKNVKEKRLSFTSDMKKSIEKSKVIYIAVGTPSNSDGTANLKHVEDVANEIAKYINEYKVIVNKCTVPVGTARKIKKIINENQSLQLSSTVFKSDSNPDVDKGFVSPVIENISSPDIKSTISPVNANISSSVNARCKATKQSRPSPSSMQTTDGSKAIYSNPSPLRGEGRVRVTYPFDIISNPEFLREGSAVYDFTHPDKIVIGYESEKAKKIMQEIYRPLYLLDTPFIFTTLETAEMIKYACNAFLATKITFINEIANICDRVGADVNQIAKSMGMDGRISPKFLHPGPGYGGSCFPKDTRALQSIANNENYDFKLLNAVIEVNIRQRKIVVDKIEKEMKILKNKKIGVLGLAFKQNTDDIRESAAIDIIKMLLQKGAQVKCYDPMAMEKTKEIMPELVYCQDEYETAQDTDALVVLTEWDQFRNLDFKKIKLLMKRHEYGLYFQPFIFDIKNLYEPEKIKKLDFKYFGMGRN